MLSLFRSYRKERNVNYYAKKQHISPRYFSSIIKEKSGSSASYWIVQMVITEAKQLLESSNLSIKEVAAQLNFPTQSFLGNTSNNMSECHLKNTVSCFWLNSSWLFQKQLIHDPSHTNVHNSVIYSLRFSLLLLDTISLCEKKKSDNPP